ncbi:MAG: YcgN family cysteine cluster protein [Vibrionaceae bacterium]
MNKLPFWQQKSLDEMNEQEWEQICDGCAKCCLHKFIDDDTDDLHYTNIACELLDSQTCQCSDYANRFARGVQCLKLTKENLPQFYWLPATCSYRLLMENQPLPEWHPLLTGSKEAMHAAKGSVQNSVVYEIDVIDWQDHIVESFCAGKSNAKSKTRNRTRKK